MGSGKLVLEKGSVSSKYCTLAVMYPGVSAFLKLIVCIYSIFFRLSRFLFIPSKTVGN